MKARKIVGVISSVGIRDNASFSFFCTLSESGENPLIPTEQNSSMKNEFLHHVDEPYSKMGANKLIPTDWKKNTHQNDDTINTNT